MKKSPSHQDARAPSPSSEVRETKVISKEIDPEGNKRINQYVVVRELGKGMHGKVKLCYDPIVDHYYAMKIIRKNVKKRFGSKSEHHMEKLQIEIAILKKCDHPNVVKLYEVLDSPDSEKIYLVLEYLEGGSIKWQEEERACLSIAESRSYFRDVLLGLEYLHHQGIVHRDIKPANLLLTKEGNVKISDFGVSHQATDDDGSDLALAKTAGSPAFFAPELCAGSKSPSKPITNSIDIWALGVTLYCFIYGRVPFNANSEFELYGMILNDEVPHEPGVADELLLDLFSRLLEKEPSKRIKIHEIKSHPWVTADLPDPEKWIRETDPNLKEAIHVTLDEVKNAVTFLSKLKQKIIRRLSISLLPKHRREKSDRSDRTDNSDTDSVSSYPRLKLPQAPSNESLSASASARLSPVGSEDQFITVKRSTSHLSNLSTTNFRPTIKSSISQELGFDGGDELEPPSPILRVSPLKRFDREPTLGEIKEDSAENARREKEEELEEQPEKRGPEGKKEKGKKKL